MAAGPLPPHPGVHVWSKQEHFHTIPNTNVSLLRIDEYLRRELETSLLDGVYRYLWMAGMRRESIKPLHHQRVIRRDIVVSERHHLISRGNIIYIKPIPPCLLHSAFFHAHVHGQHSRESLALGFLSSYLPLITHESDLHIANELRLFPEAVEWRDWLTFSQHLAAQIDAHLAAKIRVDAPYDRLFHNRYDFAELRLDRLNVILMLFRFRLRGYARLDTTYTEYFQSFWSVVTVLVFAFSSTAFSAFGVAIASPSRPTGVDSIGLWFAIMVLCMLGALLFLLSLWFLVIFIDNLLFAISRKQTRRSSS